MLVICESISAGLIISLINKYIINGNILDRCVNVVEEANIYESEDSGSSITVVSDTACTIHHIQT